MISQIIKTSLILIITTGITTAQSIKKFAHSNRKVAHFSNFQNFSRANNTIWGGEDGWNLMELELLAYSMDALFGIYCYDDDYFEQATQTMTSFDYNDQYAPHGWYQSLNGKTVICSTWEAAEYTSDGQVIDGGEFSTYDSLIFNNNHISESYNWGGNRGVVEYQFNSFQKMESTIYHTDYPPKYDHLTYLYEGEKMVGKVGKNNGSIDYRLDLVYGEKLDSSKVWRVDENGELLLDTYKTYRFENGNCHSIKSFVKSGEETFIQNQEWEMDYNSDNLITMTVKRKTNGDGSLSKEYRCDSTFYSYTSKGFLKTREKYRPVMVMPKSGIAYEAWEAMDKDSTVYNSVGNVIEEHYFIWSSISNQWEKPEKYGYSFYEYDDHNNLIRYSDNSSKPPYVVTYKDGYPESIVQSEDDSIYSYVKYRFIDSPSSISKGTSQEKISFSIYKGILTLDKSTKASSLELFTLSGKKAAEIKPIKGNGSITFDISSAGIAQGIYVGKISLDNSFFQQKIVVP